MGRVSKTTKWARACSKCGKWCPSSYCADCYAKENPDAKWLRRRALIEAGKKNCTDCLRVLPLTEFYKNQSGKISNWCRSCVSRRGVQRGRSKGTILPLDERRELATLGLKRCPACKSEKPVTEFGARGNRPGTTRSYCRACVNAKCREKRAANREFWRAYGRAKYHEHKKKGPAKPATVEERRKHAARWRTHQAIARGRLVRPSACSCCGGNASRIEAHHDDYTKPLDVVWLCASCHERAHSRHDAAQAALSYPLTKKVSEFLDWPSKEEDVAC